MGHLSITKLYDLSVLIFINLLAVVFSFAFETSFLVSTLLFLGLPIFYLSYREKKNLIKIIFASISFGLLLSFCFDFIAEINNAWSWNGGLVFGKLLGVVQGDVMVWFFLWVMHIFIFYEHFIVHKECKSYISEYGLATFVVGVVSIFALLTINYHSPELLYFTKAYFKLCLIVCIPFLLLLLFKTKKVLHAVYIIPYFAFVYLTHEITALKLSQWHFPGDYIGMVYMFGVSFPYEELFFWIFLSSLVGAVYYEFTFDYSKSLNKGSGAK